MITNKNTDKLLTTVLALSYNANQYQ